MNFIETEFINLIFFLFPLYVYLFYINYEEVISNKKHDILLDFSLLTSLYLTIRYGNLLVIDKPIFLINTLVLISYLKNKKYLSIFISILNIIYFINYNINLYILICLYILIFLVYNLYKIKKINKKIFILIFYIIYFLLLIYYLNISNIKIIETISILLISYLTSLIAFVLFDSSDSIIKCNSFIKKYEEENEVRKSLFKITHEIKNPIAVCKGYLDMFDKNDLDRSLKYIDIIKEEIKKTLKLMEDFLSLRTIKIKKDIIDITLLLDEVINHFNLYLIGNNIKSDFDIINDEIYIEGDYDRLMQVLINIIKNSLESFDNINSPLLKINTNLNSNYIIIKIIDNGIGMDKEILSKIKEAFYTTKKNGTGIGVSLSDEIIRSHNGNLSYESVINEGTIVTISLPIITL